MHEMRRYLLGSLLGHFGFVVIALIAASVFVRTPPGLRVMRLDLQSLELPAQEPVEAIAPPTEVVEPAETAVEPPQPVPERPAELPSRQPPLDVETRPEEVDRLQEADLRPPEPLLPREPVAEEPVDVVDVESSAAEEAVDFLEPDDVVVREDTTDAEAVVDSAAAAISTAPETVTGEGAAVQASSTDGVSDFYLARVQQKIGRRWQPSPGSAAGLPAAECLVHFRIGPSGEVIGPSVARSSGLSVFDRQAVRAVLESSPMPEVPPRFARSGLEIRFLFRYER